MEKYYLVLLTCYYVVRYMFVIVVSMYEVCMKYAKVCMKYKEFKRHAWNFKSMHISMEKNIWNVCAEIGF